VLGWSPGLLLHRALFVPPNPTGLVVLRSSGGLWIWVATAYVLLGDASEIAREMEIEAIGDVLVGVIRVRNFRLGGLLLLLLSLFRGTAFFFELGGMIGGWRRAVGRAGRAAVSLAFGFAFGEKVDHLWMYK